MIPAYLEGARKLLCIGAHCDDIEIGCGATILGGLEANPDLEVTWVVFASSERRRTEAECSARAFLAGTSHRRIIIEEFRESYFPWCGDAIKDRLEQIRAEFEPDVVLTHWRGDRHQDHRTLGELSWNTFRDEVILEYEIPKWDGDMGAPNVFVCASEAHAQKKVETLIRCYESQAGRDWFTEDLFYALMRIRGMECRSPSRLAEAFYASKLLLGNVAGR